MRGIVVVAILLVLVAIYRITHPDAPPRLCVDAPSECQR
jgi:hypothetical protein